MPATAGDGEVGEASPAGGEHEEGGSEEGVADESQRDAFEEIDFGREFQDYLDPGYKTQEIEYKEDAPTFEQFLTRPPSLAEHLEWQLHMSSIDSERASMPAICVIGNLNADGRLNATNEEMAAMEKVSEEVVERARQAVMRLDPVGCGARDVKECLLVQLEVLGESDRLAARLISEHFADLAATQAAAPVETDRRRRRNAARRVAVYSHARSVSGPALFVRRTDSDQSGDLHREARRGRRRLRDLFC